MKIVDFQLEDLATERALMHSGRFITCINGDSAALQAYDVDSGAALISSSTPYVSFSNGRIRFGIAESVEKVDIYGYTSKGYAFQIKDLVPGSINSFKIDINRLNQTIIYPFAFADTVRGISASAENKTGWFLPNGLTLRPEGVGVFVSTAESGKSIDVGLDGANSGVDDADGFIDGMILTTAGWVEANEGYTVGTNRVWLDLTGGDKEWTKGALYYPSNTKQAKAEGADAASTNDSGIYIHKAHVSTNSGTNTEELSYTLSGTPTAVKGFIHLPARLTNLPAYP